jgi:exonuclease VII large subunit
VVMKAGKIIRSTRQVGHDDALQIKVHDGTIHTRVE